MSIDAWRCCSSLLRRVARGFAVYDLAITLPFLTPWTAEVLLRTFREVHLSLLLGSEPMPAFTPQHVFFVTLFGVLAAMGALVRILQPTALHGGIDAVGRVLVSTWMTLAVVQGASQVIGSFLVMEAVGAVVQGSLLWAFEDAPTWLLLPRPEPPGDGGDAACARRWLPIIPR